jgi:hypothetical protein
MYVVGKFFSTLKVRSTTFECEQMLGFEEPQQNLVELS